MLQSLKLYRSSITTRCNEKKSNGASTTTSLEGKESTFEQYPKKGINETDMNTKEGKNMKEEPMSEKQLERILVTAKEAPSYNREVPFLLIFMS